MRCLAKQIDFELYFINHYAVYDHTIQHFVMQI